MSDIDNPANKNNETKTRITPKLNKLHSKAYYLIIDSVVWCIGATFYSVAINCFASPNRIAPGGVTGISTLINYKLGLPIGVMVMLFNIPILTAAYKVFGKKFIARTVVGTILTSVFIDLGQLFLPAYTGDRLLSSMFGGAFAGIGLGLILSRGATSGGTDILGRLLKLKFPHISLGSFILGMDLSVMIFAGLIYGNIESMLYSGIFFFISSKSIDYLVFGASKSTLLLIVTTFADIIPGKIISEVGRGVTVLPVTGAYTGEEKNMLVTVARPHEIAKITRIVKMTDPGAFVIKTDAGEVFGKGFKTDDNSL